MSSDSLGVYLGKRLTEWQQLTCFSHLCLLYSAVTCKCMCSSILVSFCCICCVAERPHGPNVQSTATGGEGRIYRLTIWCDSLSTELTFLPSRSAPTGSDSQQVDLMQCSFWYRIGCSAYLWEDLLLPWAQTYRVQQPLLAHRVNILHPSQWWVRCQKTQSAAFITMIINMFLLRVKPFSLSPHRSIADSMLDSMFAVYRLYEGLTSCRSFLLATCICARSM